MAAPRIGIAGAGAWGTALAQTARAAGRDVVLWAHTPATADEISAAHTNSTFLPGIALDPGIRATARLADLAGAEIVLLVVPAQHLRTVAVDMAAWLAAGTPVVICAKGIELATGRLMTEALGEALPQGVPAVLSGPSFAHDVARGLPTAVTIACREEALGQRLVHAIGHKLFRPYWSDDLIGVQLGGALKNVLAIAAGIVDGQGLGASAHAALVTRGFAEMVRLGRALGARMETLAGLSGLGDLVLTCGSPASRNMSLGRALGQGRTIAEVLAERRSVAEGVATSSAVVTLARRHGIEMPIAGAVEAVLGGTLTVQNAIDGLLSRPFKAEG